MNVYSELVRAQFEHLSSEPTGLSGRFFLDTADARGGVKIYLSGGAMGSMWSRIKTHKEDFVYDNSGNGYPIDWANSPNQYTRLDSSYPMSASNPRNGEVYTIRITSPTSTNRGSRAYFPADFEMCGESYMPFMEPDETRTYQFKYDSSNSQVAHATYGTVNAPFTALAGAANHVAIAPNGKHIAFAHDTTPFLTVYDMDGPQIGRQHAAASTLPAGNAQAVAWHPSGMYVAVAHATTPFVSVYEFDQESGTIGAKLTNPATLPAGQGNGVAWSPCGTYIAVAHSTTPYVSVYPWTAAGFGTKLADPATVPTGNAYAVAWRWQASTLSHYLAVAHDTSPYVSVYPISVGAFGTKITNPATLPTGSGRGVAFNPQDNYLAVAHTTTPFISVYPFTTSIGVKIADPSTLPGGNAETCAWSPNGSHLYVGGATTTVTAYTWASNALTATSSPGTMPTTTATGISVSDCARYLAMSGSGATSRALLCMAARPIRRYFLVK